MGIETPYGRTFDEQSGKTTPTDECPECNGTLQTDGGETCCTQCGLIVDAYRIDHGPDWLAVDETSTPRVGPPRTVTRHDRGLSTTISDGGDANGRPLSGRKRAQINRLRREHSRARFGSKADRNLAHGLGEIARIAAALGLASSYRERASDIFRAAQSEGLLPGRSIESMAAASVYAACRCAGNPRSLAEVQHVARGRESLTEQAYRVLNRDLDLPTKPQRPRGYVSRLASEVDASPSVRRHALELAVAAEESDIANGRNPAGVAAACLYLAGEECSVRYTQSALADFAGVTPVTLRERYYELRDRCDGEAPRDTASEGEA